MWLGRVVKLQGTMRYASQINALTLQLDRLVEILIKHQWWILQLHALQTNSTIQQQMYSHFYRCAISLNLFDKLFREQQNNHYNLVIVYSNLYHWIIFPQIRVQLFYWKQSIAVKLVWVRGINKFILSSNNCQHMLVYYSIISPLSL